MDVFILSGGASARMGFDKAKIEVDGTPILAKQIQTLLDQGLTPTILGATPVEGLSFVPDTQVHGGPLRALRGVRPQGPAFVLSCDIPLFDGKVATVLQELLGDFDAVLPSLGGRLQPLCAVYSSSAWKRIDLVESDRMMGWVDQLNFRTVEEPELIKHGLRPWMLQGANTPEELSQILALRDSGA